MSSSSVDESTVQPETAVSAGKWEPVADDVLAAIRAKIEPTIRKASDDLYGDLLDTVQDYLCENAAFNIKSRIEAADRQALSDRQALHAEKAKSAAMLGALTKIAAGGGDVQQTREGLITTARAAIAKATSPDQPVSVTA